MDDKKYDRQLRLWGHNGQKALAESNILLINADATGSETLKNLVLPGVGRFTIVDDKLVTDDDLGVNFFVSDDYIGRQRAETVVALLSEMNPDVTGVAINKAIDSILASSATFLNSFNLVIISNQNDSVILKVSELCRKLKISLVVTKSYGLIGYLRIQVTDHDIIESKPENVSHNLHIFNPFPELAAFCTKFDMTQMDSQEHSHTPYVVILYQCLQEYLTTGNNKPPSNTDEKKAFVNLVKNKSRNFNNEMNFQEASKEAYKAYTTNSLPEEVIALLDGIDQCPIYISDPNSTSRVRKLDDFIILVKALKIFIERTNSCPSSGSIPDMTASTNFYIELQSIYQAKSLKDKEDFTTIVHFLLNSIGRESSEISSEKIDLFCKNITNLRRISTRSIAEEISGPLDQSVVDAFDDPYADSNQTPIIWYIGLRAAEIFYSKCGRYPGLLGGDDAQFENDKNEVFEIMKGFMTTIASRNGSLSDSTSISISHAEEICRYAATEVHVIAAIIGGVASQEAVKIISKQYVPINNTFVYNGISCNAATYEL